MSALRIAWPLAALACAFWPIWGWFVAGTMDGSNDAGGLLAAAAAIWYVARTRARPAIAWPLLLPIACLILYLLCTVIAAPTAVRAALAVGALASFASASRMGRRCDLALLALCLLALPVAATLQFYVGFPLRLLAGELSAVLLRMNGVAVVREGAMLVWDGQRVAIDAPCSGLKMLWAGLFVAGTLAAGARLPALGAAAMLALSATVMVAANALRAAALFYMETGLVSMPSWAHPGIGVICYAAAAAAILLSVRRMKGDPA